MKQQNKNVVKKLGFVIFTLVAGFLQPLTLSAQNLTWSGGNGAWTDAGAWSGGDWSDYENAIFSGPGGTVALGANKINASDLTFNSGDYTLGDTFTPVLGISGNINTAAGINATIASNIETATLVKTGEGTLRLSGTNKFTSGITVSNGVLSFDSRYAVSTNAGNGLATITLSGGTLRFNNVGVQGSVAGSGTITVNGSGVLENYQAVAITLQGINGSGTLTFTGTAGVNPSGGNTNASDLIKGNVDLVIESTGIIAIWSNNNTNTGNTYINKGQLIMYGTNAVIGSGTVFSNRGTYLTARGNTQTIAALYDGVTGGGLVRNASTGTATFIIQSGVFSGTIMDNNATQTLKLIKSGTGTLRLSGNTNRYSEGTDITGGTLLVNNPVATGTVLGTGAVTVSGGTLGGTGYINGNTVTVGTGGVLAPGDNGVGTLTFGSDLTLDGTLLFDVVSAASYDKLALKNFTIGSGAGLELAAANGFIWEIGEHYDFNLFTVSGNTNGSLLESNIILTGLSADQYIAQWSSLGTLGITIIPEPGTLTLLGIGLGLLAITRWRSRARPVR